MKRTPREWKQYFESEQFEKEYTYKEYDLGMTYTKEKTVLKLWAPTADSVLLNLYAYGTEEEEAIDQKNLLKQTEAKKRYQKGISLTKGEKGVWSLTLTGDYHNVYYDYEVTVDGKTRQTADPYAVACGANSKRSMIIDLSSTNPEGWEEDKSPREKIDCPFIYEVHIKDFSYDENSGIKKEYRGKYLAFTQEGTTYQNDGVHPTGIDYLKQLGVTHVHLLPPYDYGSVDELGEDSQFNWGYDPVNYNVPEGSYSTEPREGAVRIQEFKQMVMALHKAGINVVLDTVLNHTYSSDSWFEKTVPHYYYRQWEDGSICDGSDCSNDTASDRSMFGQYMKQSLLYWAKEYHVDGFRFDLMGLHHTDIMNEIRKELDALPDGKNIIMYGEPWTASKTLMKEKAIPAIKDNVEHLHERVAIFCDSTRDAIKGHVFYGKVPGFVNGKEGLEKEIEHSVVAWCDGSKNWKPKAPSQIISYVSAHDNFTLWDKLLITLRKEPAYEKRDEEIVRMNKLVAAIVFTCQGMVFIQAGEEFARTKLGEENSYCSSAKLNQLDWKRTIDYADLVEYYKGLYQIRKQFGTYGYFGKDAYQYCHFLKCKEKKVVAFTMKNVRADETYEQLFVAYNANKKEVKINLPDGETYVLLADESSATREKEGKEIKDFVLLKPQSAMICGKPQQKNEKR